MPFLLLRAVRSQTGAIYKVPTGNSSYAQSGCKGVFVSGGMAEVGGCGLAAPNQAPLMRAKGGAERTKNMVGKLFVYSSSSLTRSFLLPSIHANAVVQRH